MRRFPLVLSVFTLAAAGGAATLAPREAEFEELALTLEVNVSDGTSEVILHAETGLPLERVTVIAPDGRVVQRLDATTPGGIGLSELHLESGEPDLETLRSAYPEGLYRVRARALDGTLIVGAVELSHALPARWNVVLPRTESGRVDRDAVVVEWGPAPGSARTTVEVVDDENDVARFSATPLPGSTSLRVPSELLELDHEYQVIVSAWAASGNRLIQERFVHTAR